MGSSCLRTLFITLASHEERHVFSNSLTYLIATFSGNSKPFFLSYSRGLGFFFKHTSRPDFFYLFWNIEWSCLGKLHGTQTHVWFLASLPCSHLCCVEGVFAIKAGIVYVYVDTCEMDKPAGTGFGGTTVPVRGSILVKVLSARAVSTCKMFL